MKASLRGRMPDHGPAMDGGKNGHDLLQRKMLPDGVRYRWRVG